MYTPKIVVQTWVSYNDSVLQEYKENSDIGGLGGFFEDGMRWKDYVSCWPEEIIPYLEALRTAIVEKNLKCGGDEHQYGEDCVPVFNTGEYATWSFRGWGDLMAAVWSEEENKDYSYMDFYMNTTMSWRKDE